MVTPIHIQLPLSRQQAATLKTGDAVLLSGPVFTMRDAGHERALSLLLDSGELPFCLAGHTIFFAGPSPPAAGRPLGSVGPTTAGRMDFATPALFEAGIVAAIGKGERSAEVRESCRETGSVYFAAVGGSAALLAKCVTASELVAWEDLGTEALRRLTLENFPAFVACDTSATSIYR